MGDYYHFYKVSKQGVAFIMNHPNVDAIFEFDSLLTLDPTAPLYEFFNSCNCIRQEPRSTFVLTKEDLKRLLLVFFKQYQQYLVQNSLAYDRTHLEPYDVTSPDIWNRCVGVAGSKEDEAASLHFGDLLRGAEYINYCSDNSEEKFLNSLDNPDILCWEHSQLTSLLQLVYFYKTWDDRDCFVVSLW